MARVFAEFPEEGRATPEFRLKPLLFGKIFAENPMKMKEIEPRGGARP